MGSNFSAISFYQQQNHTENTEQKGNIQPLESTPTYLQISTNWVAKNNDEKSLNHKIWIKVHIGSYKKKVS